MTPSKCYLGCFWRFLGVLWRPFWPPLGSTLGVFGVLGIIWSLFGRAIPVHLDTQGSYLVTQGSYIAAQGLLQSFLDMRMMTLLLFEVSNKASNVEIVFHNCFVQTWVQNSARITTKLENWQSRTREWSRDSSRGPTIWMFDQRVMILGLHSGCIWLHKGRPQSMCFPFHC